jgi:hypothetical protein
MALKRASVLVAVAVAVSSLVAPSATAQPEAVASEGKRLAAQEAYRQAVELFDHGKYAEALAEFERANTLAPSFRISYNIGLSHAALGDALAAVEAFASYLREGGERVPAPRRKQVEAEVARLTQQLAWLSIQVDEPAAEVTVDGAPLAKGPFSRQLQLNGGRHEIAVRGADGTLKTQSVTLTAGGEQRLHFPASGAAAGATSSSGRDSATPAAPPPGARQVPWVAWGVTGALGASVAVTGVLALGAHADERDLKTRQGLQPGELVAARDKVENLALATDILLVGTAVAAGVSLYFTLRQPADEDRRTSLTLAPGSVSVRGCF